jgi:hypothetical protein
LPPAYGICLNRNSIFRFFEICRKIITAIRECLFVASSGGSERVKWFSRMYFCCQQWRKRAREMTEFRFQISKYPVGLASSTSHSGQASWAEW